MTTSNANHTSRSDDDSSSPGPFTVHWAIVPEGAGRTRSQPGLVQVAIWPSPVNSDVCFEKAGFTEFGDADEGWDVHASELLSRILENLVVYGSPRLLSEPLTPNPIPWYRRPFAKPNEPLCLKKHVEFTIHWDSLPECEIAFGDGGAALCAGSGHVLYWVTIPRQRVPEPLAMQSIADGNSEFDDATVHARLASWVAHLARPHPVRHTVLRFEFL